MLKRLFLENDVNFRKEAIDMFNGLTHILNMDILEATVKLNGHGEDFLVLNFKNAKKTAIHSFNKRHETTRRAPQEEMASKRRAIDSVEDDGWAELYTRLINSADDGGNNGAGEVTVNLINNKAANFLKLYANKHGFNGAFLMPAILTTINFMLSRIGARVQVRDGFVLNLNTYWLFVGQPTTGKSSAIKHGITDPIPDSIKDSLISSTTSSGLTKLLSKKSEAYIVNSEISEYISRFAKNDENNTGEIENICKIYSGETININYATENQRHLKGNIPFCILGSTQLKNISMLLATIDRNDGFWERFLVTVPTPYRPSPEEQVSANRNFGQEFNFDMNDFYSKLQEILDPENPPIFYLGASAAEFLNKLETEFIHDSNSKMRMAIPVKSSKLADTIPKIAVALHTMEKVFAILCDNSAIGLDEEVSLEMVIQARNIINNSEEQKFVLKQFVRSIMPSRTVNVFVPSQQNLCKVIMTLEYQRCCEYLAKEGYGQYSSVKNGHRMTHVFLKKAPELLDDSLTTGNIIPMDLYVQKYNQKIHSTINARIIEHCSRMI
ncbi:uncharacterized protein [Clytia hemisphaerica]|uniref:uncharacterized protein n=1 Tax=Clytia hemisphaerica TaxID=252671 RepID=UPI0034D658DA